MTWSPPAPGSAEVGGKQFLAALGAGLSRFFQLRAQEWPALLYSALGFFFLLSGYYLIRPVRDEFTQQFGVLRIHQLYIVTFLVMLVLVPLWGALVRAVERRILVSVVLGVVMAALLGFHLALGHPQLAPWAVPSLAIFISVSNLFIVSVFWSLATDVLSADQSRRFFGVVATGGTLGGVGGLLLTLSIVGVIGVRHLLLLSVGLFAAAWWCLLALSRWGAEHPRSDRPTTSADAIGGAVWSGASAVLTRPFMALLAGVMFLGVGVGNVAYFNLQVVMQRIADPIERTELFALLDLIQNVLAIALQVLVTRRLLPQWGAGPLMLVAVSVYTLGFFSLIVWTLPVLVYALSSAGRGLNFGLFNPARESLFALVEREERYKAKNFIDTFVYRAADASFQSTLVTLSKLGLVLPHIAAVGLALSMLLAGVVYATWRRAPSRAES